MFRYGQRTGPWRRRYCRTKACRKSRAGRRSRPRLVRIQPRRHSVGMFILVQVIVGGLLLGAVYALFSSGLTLIWGMMNVINFAHGDFVMLGMYVAFVVWTLLGVGPFVGAPVAALVLATLGVIVYFGLIRSDERADVGADTRHLWAGAVAALLRVLGFWRQFHDADGKPCRRHV